MSRASKGATFTGKHESFASKPPGARLFLLWAIAQKANVMDVLNVAIVGSELAGLTAATELITSLGKNGVKITIIDPRNWIGGQIRTLRSGDVGPMFLTKKRHPELDQLLQLWHGKREGGWETRFYLGDEEPTFPQDDAYAPSSGLTRYLGANGELDSAEVEAGLEILRGSYIPALCAELQLTGMDPVKLTPQQEQLQQLSVAQWLSGEPLPGVQTPFPEVSDAALESFRLMWAHDNGVALEDQNLLAMLRMLDGNGHGYYSGGTKIVRGGGSTVTQAAHEWLVEQGVEFRLNCVCRLSDANDPALHFADGSVEKFDRVIVALPPAVHDECIFDPEFSSGDGQFWNVALKPEFAKTITTWDSYAPFGETWQSFLHRNTLVFFASARGRDVPPYAELEALFPGISENVVSVDTLNWLREPNTRSSFTFPKPGNFGAISRALSRHRTSPIAIVGEWVCDEVGYPGAAVRNAQQVVREMLAA